MMVVTQEVEVVISGIGGYFPRSTNIEELQQLLMDHVDCIDAARWKAGHLDVCDKTGNVELINQFDASYFGIHHKQSLFMDPMSRMTMQNTLEALIDAGTTPVSMRGRRVLVATATTVSENDSLMFEDVENGFGVTGQARAMLANRISYWLNVTGPSYSCDSSWLGGLQVLQHGYNAIRSGQCEAAIVVAANLTMNIYPTYHYKNMKLTSPDGHTRSFDENADGYARSDGTCVLYLQRGDKARRRYATIVDVDLTFNGCRSGQLIAADPDGARDFLTGFYQRAGVDPAQVNYVESYGAGIKNLDKLELRVLDDVFNNGNREQPLLIGAVKTNLGHSEPSNQFASIVKVIIAMESGIIPANFNCSSPGSVLPILMDGRLQLVSENTPWSGSLAAVNGFGLASSYGHALLRRNPVEKRPDTMTAALKLPLLHVLATRNEDGIKEIVDKVKTKEVLDLDYMCLMNGVFSTHINGYLYRGYVVKTAGGTCREESAFYSGIHRPVWFVYSGMGSQWQGMGKALLNLPVFTKVIQRCAAALKPFGVDLMRILTSDDNTMFDNILNSFVGIAAVQIGLTDVLTALGIKPDGIVGHSVGELGCAYADGCLTAEQMVLAAYYRGRASQEATLIPGLMAAVGIGASEAVERIPSSVDVACHNGPDSSTLSGPKEDMEMLVKEMQESGVFARLVNVAGIAYHSRYIRPVAPLLLDYLNQLIPSPKERSAKWVSSSVPQQHWQTDLVIDKKSLELARYASAEYLTNNLLSAVYFEEALRTVPKDAVLIEIAPHGLLQAILRRSVDPDTVNIPLTKRGHDNGLEFLFTAIGKLYLSGLQLNLSALYEDTYPMESIVPRGTPSLAPLVRWENTERWRTGLDEFKDYSKSEQTYPLDSHSEWFRDVIGHRACNAAIIPATAYLPLVCAILSNTKKVDAVEFTDFSVKRQRTLPVRDEYVPPVRVMVARGSGLFEICDRYGIVANGQTLVPEQQQMQQMLQTFDEDKSNNQLLGEELCKLSGDEVYRELAARGLELSGVYRAITELHVYKNGVQASIIWKNWSAFTASFFHTRMFHSSASTRCLVPGYFRRLVINFERVPSEGTVLQVRYTHTTDTLSSHVMQLVGAVCIPLADNIKIKFAATATRFVSHQMQDLELNPEMIVDICLQITKRQIGIDVPELNVIACNDPSTRAIRNIIRKASTQHTKFKILLNVVHSITNNKIETSPTPNLLVVGFKQLEDVPQYLQESPNTHVLVCSEELNQPLSKSNFIEVMACQANGSQFRLVKQLCKKKLEVVNVNEKVINNEELGNSIVSWVCELETKLSSNSNERVYLSCRTLPKNNLDSFVNIIQRMKGGHKARFVFILDDNAPKLTPAEPFYSYLFQQDITVSVYEHGCWGSHYTSVLRLSDLDLIEEDNQTADQEVSSSNISAKNVDVRYIGVHAASVVPVETDNGFNITPKLGLVDYCGIKKGTNCKIMGICDGTLTPDPIFQWSLPDSWTLVDGATVPAAYAIAYYVLVELTSLAAGETVLVHNACSAVGQAVIRVAYSLGAQVLASVANDRQRALLLNHMRMLTNETVFDFTTARFEQQVMAATQGDGIRVLINCLRGERLQAGIRCIATLGRAILLQDETDPNSGPDTDNIGLSTFFRCVGMYGVRPARLCDLRDETKRKVHQFVQEGLNVGHVVPIRRNIFRQQQSLKHVINYVMGSQVIGSVVLPIQAESIQIFQQNTAFRCDANSTYVVFGGDKTDMESTSLTATWLAKHGARKLLLVANPRTKDDRVFLQRQMQWFNIHVELVETLPPPTRLKSAAGIVVLPGVKIPEALPLGVKLIVCTDTSFSSPLPLHSQRSTLRWDKKSRYVDAIHFLGYALSHTVDLMLLGNEDNTEQIVEETFTYKDFFRLLANSVPSLAAVRPVPVDSVTVQLVNSASSRNVVEVPALFLVPGLLGESCRYLQQMVTKLMCPVYVINVGQKSQSIDQLSAALAERIRTVHPKGPYNIAGVSTGGVLALEVAKLLEVIVGSSNVQLYLLDAVPATLQNLVREAQTANNNGLDGVILQYFMHLNQLEVVNELITRHKSWQAKLSAVLNLTDLTRGETQQVAQALNMTRGRLNQILNYIPSERILNAPTRLLRPHESSKDLRISLINTCKQLKVEVMKGNHFTMLQSQSLADYINDNFIVAPIYT